jgi:hypothetical protein
MKANQQCRNLLRALLEYQKRVQEVYLRRTVSEPAIEVSSVQEEDRNTSPFMWNTNQWRYGRTYAELPTPPS